MKNSEKQILLQEYEVLKKEFLKNVKDGKIYIPVNAIGWKCDTPYLCRIIVKIFGHETEIQKHFSNVIENFSTQAPKTYAALAEQDKELPAYTFAPFDYKEVKLRLMLLDEIIESLS